MAARHRAVRFIAAATAAAAALGVFTYGESRPSADKINNASLIIGTYLIDFEALNEENQALAEKNAEDKNQTRVYYKSDLNSGVWYDITDAENVNDILLTNSRIVDDSTIDALELTMYFKADGTVVDLTTGSVVSVQAIDSTVLPAQIDACSSLVQQLEIANSLVESTDDYDDDNDQETHQHNVYVAERDSLNAILAPVSDGATASLAKKLNALDPVLNACEGAAADSVAALKVKLRAQLDKHCCEVVYNRIEEQVSNLSSPDKSDHADLISALTDVQSALLEDIATLDSSAGSDSSSGSGDETGSGDSTESGDGTGSGNGSGSGSSFGVGAAAKKQTELENSLISAAEDGNISGAVAEVDRLATLAALVDGTSVDPAKAADMAEELYTSAMDSISEISTAANNGGLDGMTSQEAATSFTAAIKDAENYAKDSAFYTAGDTSSAEYNELTAEKLEKLGRLLEELPEGSGSVAEDLSAIARDSASDILDKAAAAGALADSAVSAEKSRTEALQKQIDDKYDEYIDALSSGDDALADQKKSELDALIDMLAKEQGNAAASIDEKYSALFDAKNASDADKIRAAQAEKDALKGLISDADAGLLDQFDDALSAFEDKAGKINADGSSQAESAYDDLKTALTNVPADCMSDDTRAKALTYAASLLRDNGVSALDRQLQDDIAAAKAGQLSPDSAAQDNSDPSNPSAPSTPGNTPGSSTLDDLYQYKLIIPKYEIYSNELSLELDGVVYLDAEKLAEFIGAQFIRAKNIYVIKGEDILMEFAAGDPAAYIGDKLLALADPPRVIGDTVYIPSGLFAAGCGLTETTENGTLFMR